MLELKEKIVFYGNEKYCLYYNQYSYILIFDSHRREVICTYEIKGGNIAVYKTNTASIYFFNDEAIKKGIQIIKNKK